MLARNVVTLSFAALTAVALSVPVASAQGGDAGSVPTGSAVGSVDAGSLPGGSLGSESADDTSVGDLVPESETVCDLPDLGGSVAKFYPLFGLSDVPAGVLDIITSALSSFPNLLDVVAGDGGGAALVGQTGSFADPLCTSVFGGEMVLPPLTVIVDEEGAPLTTVTGTVAPGPGPGPGASSGSSGSAEADASTTTTVPTSTVGA